MDRFDAMQAFARVVETGSFTKAAQTLHLSKTTVTHLVQQLEARLRVRLLNRTTRKVNVTPDGAACCGLTAGSVCSAELSRAGGPPRSPRRVGTAASPYRWLILVGFATRVSVHHAS